MLTGRESLLRLIGKRRHFLPNRHSILSESLPTFQSCFNLCPDDNNNNNNNNNDVLGIGFGKAVELNQLKPSGDNEPGNRLSSSGEVDCPVCGSKIPGGNNEINSHLDVCLSRGTKRKLTQRTLLQLNFSPVSKVKIVPDDLVESNNIGNALPTVTAAQEEIQDNDCEELTEKDIPGNDPEIDCMVSNSSLSLKNDVPEGVSDDYEPIIFGATLDTFIVGRKYTDLEEICPGATIALLRDSQNVKDSNAIKVVSADSECCKLLGFLPRELAQYLSPLIDEYGLRFQGHVTSVPKHSLDVVPIQITRHRSLDGESEFKDDTFKCLWKNAQHVVELASKNPLQSLKYQQNFCLMLQEVLRNNCHLLTEDEKNYIESFILLSNDSQRLFIRIYTRKGPWFRVSSISYPEIMDVEKAVKGLFEKGYVCFVEEANQLPESDANDFLNTLVVSELREIWCALEKSHSRGMKKQDLISSMLSTYADGLWPCLSTMIMDRTGSCVRVSSKVESLMWRTERLFFLNGEQDLSSFLLVDIGKVKYPTYKCIISEPIFSKRSDLLSYEEAIEVAQIMDEAIDENRNDIVLRCIKIAESRVSTALPIQYLTSESVVTIHHLFTASWVYSKIVTLGISFLEKERRYSDAVDLLKWLLDFFTCDAKRGYWMLRLSVNLEHLGRIDESLQVAENGLLDTWVRAGSRMALQRRVIRLGKPPRRWKVPSFSRSALRKIPEVYVQGRPLNSELGAKNRFYNEEGEQCGVEQLALHYYAGEEGGGWQGVHTESGIWLTIFGLLMWDVIYADVPNVFYTRFQNAPLDLGTDSFYSLRKSSIESRLQQIRDGMGDELLIKSWETHNGTACRGVSWDHHSLDELRAAVTCVGGSCLASLCQLLAQDYRSWSSGMPDLLLWRFHGDYSGEAKLVEVKGPRDRLSEQQRAWLLLLMDCGFTIEVCKVKPL